MTGLLQDKICIVTGAASGIGKQTALTFASEGGMVIVNGRRQGSADDWIAESPMRDRMEAVYFDVTDSEMLRTAILNIKKKYGHIDVLVNNAGVEFDEAIGMVSREKTEEMFRTNVWGTIEMLQTVSRIMARNRNGGCIINIASVTGISGNAGQLGYSATKGAVIALTKSAARELAVSGIRVNAIAPGLTKTAMMEKTDAEKLIPRIKNICMGRLAEPEDIAGGCLLLASDYARYISGQVLSVDGCSII